MFYVHEVFTSIQGEGYHTGRPAHFIRFSGCACLCSFCDTKESWQRGEPITLTDLWSQLVKEHEKYPKVDNVVFTGGEPLLNNPHLHKLMELFQKHMPQKRISIETSGVTPDAETFMDSYGMSVEITLSPKPGNILDAQTYLPVAKSIAKVTDILKFVVGGEIDINTRIPNFFEQYGALYQEWGSFIYLQPMDTGDLGKNKIINQLCVDTCLRKGWRLSVQTHKILGIR